MMTQQLLTFRARKVNQIVSNKIFLVTALKMSMYRVVSGFWTLINAILALEYILGTIIEKIIAKSMCRQSIIVSLLNPNCGKNLNQLQIKSNDDVTDNPTTVITF